MDAVTGNAAAGDAAAETGTRGPPCGACRQLLAEYAADVPIVMDRGDAAPETTTAAALLPQFFTGASLRL